MTMPTTAEKPKREPPEVPDGCVLALAPDGETPVVVKKPRGPGPWFRVHHELYGARLVHAGGPDEAVRAFAEEFAPGSAANEEWFKQLKAQCRVARLAEANPAPVVTEQAAPEPEKPKPRK
jgi:hypothetical protein